MGNALNLGIGSVYHVVKSFMDFDGVVHPVGESWTYEGTNFLPYDDGLTLHVRIAGTLAVYRLQWRKDEKAIIIEHIGEYVERV